jgi:thioredoxin 1
MASIHVIEINDLSFEQEILQSKTPVLVDFTATWCGPCKQLAPIVDPIAEENAGQIKVAKLDVDQAPETAKRYGIRGVPTVLAFQNGEISGCQIGLTNKKALLALVGR